MREKTEREKNERKPACDKCLEYIIIDPRMKILEDETENNKETFSIKCTLKRDYDLLTELCDNQETFKKFRNWMKQEKEEKIKKPWKELLKLDPELEITPRKNNKREYNQKINSMLQTQGQPSKAKTTPQKKYCNIVLKNSKTIFQGSE